ncbi:MAG TPA: hypothetical protein VHU23_15915 [Rhizomicrobium sp.]|jgi:large-conductance mechanosensitive channel|nr:hypothetical protein [Rhizomicrobium sp.]
MRAGFIGIALFVIAVVALVFAKMVAIAAKFTLFYTLRLHANAPSLPWIDYAPTMPAVITFLLLAAALYLIVTRRFLIHEKYWAYATLGMLVGFWLK